MVGRNSEFSDGRRFRAEGVTYTRARRRACGGPGERFNTLLSITEQAALQLDNRGPCVGDWRPTPPPDRAERVRRTVIESV